jgi:hypothetical protein
MEIANVRAHNIISGDFFKNFQIRQMYRYKGDQIC